MSLLYKILRGSVTAIPFLFLSLNSYALDSWPDNYYTEDIKHIAMYAVLIGVLLLIYKDKRNAGKK